jgi:hypothetical protein
MTKNYLPIVFIMVLIPLFPQDKILELAVFIVVIQIIHCLNDWSNLCFGIAFPKVVTHSTFITKIYFNPNKYTL